MKLSELTPADVALHAVVSEQDPDYPLLPTYLEAARKYVLDYTGLDAATADEKPDLTVAALVLAADMVKNKEATVENDKMNKVLESFLGLHCVNLL